MKESWLDSLSDPPSIWLWLVGGGVILLSSSIGLSIKCRDKDDGQPVAQERYVMPKSLKTCSLDVVGVLFI